MLLVPFGRRSVLQDVFEMDRGKVAADYLEHRHGVVAHAVNETFRIVFVYPPGIQDDTPPLPAYEASPTSLVSTESFREARPRSSSDGQFAAGWFAALRHARALHAGYEIEALERGSLRGLKLVVLLGGIFMNASVVDAARAWLATTADAGEAALPAVVVRSNGPSNMRHASDINNIKLAAAARAWARSSPAPVLFWDVFAMLFKVWPFMLAGEPEGLRRVGAEVLPGAIATAPPGEGACSCHWAHKDLSGIVGPVNAELARQAIKWAEKARKAASDA